MKPSFDTERLYQTVPAVFSGEGEFENAYGKTVPLFFAGEPYRGRETRVFAYMGIPDGAVPEGGFPAVVLAHGGGGCAFYQWVEFWNAKGYAAIAPDFSGRQYGSRELDGPAGDGIIPANPDAGPGGYGSCNNTEKDFFDSWTYHSVCNIIFAHNLLRNHPSVNAEKTVLTGISWGGVLTCITAGVDDRFCAFAPVYGSGNLRATYCASLPEQSEEQARSWDAIYDPDAYLHQCKKPILFTVGADDPAFPITGNTASAELCQGEVTYSNRLSLTHYHRWKDEEGMAIVWAFCDSIIKNRPLTLRVLSAQVCNGRLLAQIHGSKHLKDALFCYSDCVGKDSREWKWKSVQVVPDADGMLCSEIPENARVCFFELSDTSVPQQIISTKAFFLSCS